MKCRLIEKIKINLKLICSVFGLCLALLPLCAYSAQIEACDPQEEFCRRATEGIQQLRSELKTALKQALKEQGPLAAIGVCRHRAPEIAQQLQQDCWYFGRSSRRYRNETNAPNAWQRKLLRYFEDSGARQGVHMNLSASGWVYAEPIYVQDLCLRCHGNHIKPALKQKIDRLYPQDQARGYAAGDFRGIFWAWQKPVDAAR